MPYAVNAAIARIEAPPIAEAMTWVKPTPGNRALLNLCQAVPSYPPAEALQDEVARAAPDLGVDEPRMPPAVTVNACIHDPQLYSLQFREHADRRTAGEEVPDHLLRHGARVRTDATIGDAVIGREHDRNRMRDGGPQRALNRAHLRGQWFKSTERAQWLRKRIQSVVGGLATGLVHRWNLSKARSSRRNAVRSRSVP